MNFYNNYHLPIGSTKIVAKNSDAVAIIWNGTDDQPRGMVFYGKQSKPIWRYRFRSLIERESRIKEAFENRAAHAARTAARRIERAATVHNFQVGHILAASWGYDQTNVNFYQVTKIISVKMVELRPIASMTAEVTGDMTSKVLPVADQFTGEPIRKRASRDGVRMNSYMFASTWSGKPMYESSYA